MKTIHKYPIVSKTKLNLPIDAKFLSVQTQHGRAVAWFLIDADTSLFETRSFSFYGTGHDMPNDPGEYLGTTQLQDGTFVYHLFEDTHA